MNRGLLDGQMEILPAQGVGAIRFGATPHDVEALVGPPASTSEYLSDNEVEWNYPGVGLFVTFSTGNAQAVVSITVNTPNALLSGTALVGKSEEEMLRYFAERGVPVEETDWSVESAKFFEVWSLGLSVATEFGKVSAVVCAPVVAV